MKNIKIFELICYVVAGLLAIVSLYMLYANIAYINEYLASYGMKLADLGSQAVQSILGAFVPYFTYAFLVLAAGRIYHAVAVKECVCEAPDEEVFMLDVPVEDCDAKAVAPVVAEEAEVEEVAEAAEADVTVVLAETPETVVVETEEEEK